MLLSNRIKERFFTSHKRTATARLNSLLSFGIKGLSIANGFLIVTITLNYLDSARYGIWLTISSFIMWFTFFDIGLGYGLRNKLAEAISSGKYKLARIYVSTTYAIVSIITLVLSFLFFIVIEFISFNSLLNYQEIPNEELKLIVKVVFGFFFLRFILKLISPILLAYQKTALANSLGPVGNFLALITIYILSKTTEGSLLYTSFAISFFTVFVLLISSMILYRGPLKDIRPSIKYVRFKFSNNLLNTGLKFFVLQISGIVLFQTGNFIIIQNYGPQEVTPYNIAFKYFSVIQMGFKILVSPYWSAFTEAWVLKDIKWIKSTIKRLEYSWIVLAFIGIIMLIFSSPIYKIWIGDEINIPFKLSFWFMIYFLLYTYGTIHTMFINGIGKLKIQFLSSIIGALIFIALNMLFIGVLDLGIETIVISSILGSFYGPFLSRIQYNKIIENRAHGIWNK